MAQAKIAPRFRYPIDADTAARMLAAAYRVEVEARHRTFTMDAGTRDKIAHAARWLTDATLPPSLLLYGSMPGTGKTTLALAIKGMAVALHESLLEGIGAAEQSLRMRAEKHFENYVVPWPEGLQKISCYADFQRRQEWRESHPEDAEILDQKDAEKQAAITEWKARHEAEIEKVRRQAAALKAITPTYHTARDLVTMATAADAAQRRTYDYATNCSCLIIDDLGTEPVEVNNYGTRVTPLLDLLYTRYDAMKPTIITTNFGKNQIVETYGARLFDRLCEMSCRINYGGNQSYRVL